MKKFKKVISAIMLTVIFVVIGNTASIINESNSVLAAIDNYPVQQVNIVNKEGNYMEYNTNKILTWGEENNSKNQNWKFIHIKDNVFKIVNMNNGQVISPNNMKVSEGTVCGLKQDTQSENQYWVIEGQDLDVLGNYLTYKITNYSNTNLALTWSSDGTVKLSEYDNKDSQKWLLNSAGLQGFAGYSLDMDGNKKASTIGGVLGETVYVDNLTDFIKYAKGDAATTIVITKDISVDVPENYQHLDSDEKLLTKIKVGKNKTIIGSYGVSLNNIYFYLDKYSNSGNFIIKNLTIKHDETLDLNNFIPMYISQGENFWIDHCTFAGHDSYSSENGTLQEIHQRGIDEDNHPVDKFVYVGVKADYVTISDSKFDNHEYGLILGYPNENSQLTMDTYTGYPRMTMSGNYFTRMYCRAPGLMRYGNYHTFNNYVEDAHLAYTLYTRATVYSESNYYTGVKAVLDDKLCSGFTDVGSYPSVKAKVSPASTWSPTENYEYKALSAVEAKQYCENYSGAQDSAEKFKYIKELFGSEINDSETSTPSIEEEVIEKESITHNFTQDGLSSDFFTIKGSISSSKGKVQYNGLTLTKCLKVESSTNIKFTTDKSSKLTLVFNPNFNGEILIDGKEYTVKDGLLIIDLGIGSHVIAKSDVCNIYYMGLYY